MQVKFLKFSVVVFCLLIDWYDYLKANREGWYVSWFSSTTSRAERKWSTCASISPSLKSKNANQFLHSLCTPLIPADETGVAKSTAATGSVSPVSQSRFSSVRLSLPVEHQHQEQKPVHLVSLQTLPAASSSITSLAGLAISSCGAQQQYGDQLTHSSTIGQISQPVLTGPRCNTSTLYIRMCSMYPTSAAAQQISWPSQINVLALVPPRHCRLSSWSSWSSCPVTCGGGQVQRSRLVLQLPNVFGRPCKSRGFRHWEVSRKQQPETPQKQNPILQIKSCQVQHCPVDCRLSSWSGWGSCSRECSSGVRVRKRILVQQVI